MKFLTFILVLCSFGCGEDADEKGTNNVSNSDPRACAQLASELCDASRICMAESDDSCRFYGSSFGLGRSCAVCETGLIDRFCNDSTKTDAIITRCRDSVGTAECGVVLGYGREDEPGVVVPECNDAFECGDGPCLN